jgi:DNA-binding winged helix-turn-helix (wHTH) protein/TolB-like protein
MKPPTKLFYEFGEFRLDPEKHRLLRNGEIIAVTPKAVETLRVLIERPGRLVERSELMNSVWHDVAVEDGNLTVTISMLRKALGEDGNDRKFIETVPRLGYKFVADVREVVEEVPALVVERQTLSRLVIDDVISLGRRKAAGPASLLLPSSRRKAMTIAATAGAVVIATAALVYFRPWNSKPPGVATTNIRSIAVLPFKTINPDKENPHQGLGMADILITRLSNIKAIRVRPTSAVMSFENPDENSISIATKLQVDAVLEGTIYQTGDKVRVTARLIRVSDQTSIWSGQFERLSRDEFSLQNEIAMQVVDALALNLSGNEQIALTKRYTESADAYQLYLQGRYHWNKRSFQEVGEAERLFRNAIEKDPHFALAYVGLADSMIFAYRKPETASALFKAIDLDPTLAEAYATKGFYETVHGWSWQEAEADFKKSIELNPGYATAHQWYATLLEIEGRNDEGKAELRRALEINPTSYNFLADLGQLHYFSHEYDKAKEFCNKALEIYPDFPYAHVYLRSIYLQTGENDAAVDESHKAYYARYLADNRSATETAGMQKEVAKQKEIYRQGGIRKFMEYSLNVANDSDPSSSYGHAMFYAFLGEKEKALDNLEKAFEARAFMMAWVKADPVFDDLRSEPRYQAILKKMGL